MKNSLFVAFLLLCCVTLISCQNDNNSEQEILWLRHQGADMPVWVRGNFDSDVIVLVLHGGAGGHAGAYISDFVDTLETDYMVAYWDQRHAGSSGGAFAKEEFSTENALDIMTLDMKLVVDMLKTHHGQEKQIFALGHSWGVQLGTQYLLNYHDQPQLQGWIASNGPHSSTEEYSARLNYIRRWASEIEEKGLPLEIEVVLYDLTLNSPEAVLQWVNDNDPVSDWDQVLISWDIARQIERKYVYDEYVSPTSDSPDSSLKRGELYAYGPYSRTAQLFNSFLTGTRINNANKEQSVQEFYDLTPEMDRITLPTALLWGRFDYISGVESAEAYRDAISTPQENIALHLYDAAHSPMLEQNSAFTRDVKAFIEKHRQQ